MGELDKLPAVVDLPSDVLTFQKELDLVRASCCWLVDSDTHAKA